MSNFYLGDPKTALRLAHDRHAEDVKRAEWRNARYLERTTRAARREAQPVVDEIEGGPSTARPRLSSWWRWRAVLRMRGAGATG